MSGRHKTICIVEDDASFRKSLKRLLEALGYEVADYASASAFLDSPSCRRSDCFIFDINLQHLDGFFLQEQMACRGVDTPVIFVTGYGGYSGAGKAGRRGTADLLLKPFSLAEMEGALDRALGSQAGRGKDVLKTTGRASLVP